MNCLTAIVFYIQRRATTSLWQKFETGKRFSFGTFLLKEKVHRQIKEEKIDVRYKTTNTFKTTRS